jgi:hypothetical protein
MQDLEGTILKAQRSARHSREDPVQRERLRGLDGLGDVEALCRHQGVADVAQDRGAPPPAEDLNAPFGHPGERHALGAGDPRAVACDEDLSRSARSKGGRPESRDNRVLADLVACCIADKPSRSPRSGLPTLCVLPKSLKSRDGAGRARTRTRQRSGFAQGHGIRLADRQIDDRVPAAIAGEEGDLVQRERRQLDLPKQPPGSDEDDLLDKHREGRLGEPVDD